MYKYIYTNIRDAILIGRERIEIITKFISENQYCKAEDVVQGVKDNISRVPVYGTLAKMMKEGLLRDQKINRRDHRLVVDTNNPIIEISRELEEFESAYISLLEKVKEHINRRYYELKNCHYSDPGPSVVDEANRHPFRRALSGEEHRALDEFKGLFYVDDLISQLVHIFSEVRKLYMLRSMTSWPTIIKDQDILNLLNSTISAKFSDIRISMDEIFRSIKIVRDGAPPDGSSENPMWNIATELRASIKKLDISDIKKESKELSKFVHHLIGFDLIRGADYEKTSKYKWDVTQVDQDVIKKL